MRYIEMNRGPAAYVLVPPPSRDGDLDLEGAINACHVEYVITTCTSPETPTCEVRSNGVVEISLLPVCTGVRFRLGRVTEKPLAHCTAR